MSLAASRRRLIAASTWACASLVLAPGAFAQRQGASSSRAPREMKIVKFKEIGLEVWIEAEPVPWEYEIAPPSNAKDTPRLVLNSPPKVYPAMAMALQTLATPAIPEPELESFAQGLIDKLSSRMGASKPVRLQFLTWGDLKGWQGRFTMSSGGEKLDVQMFVGQGAGRSPVLLQAQTAVGKLDHASEFIRRCWSNLHYLKV